MNRDLDRLDAWIRDAEKHHRVLLWSVTVGIAVLILELSIALRLTLEFLARWIVGGVS